MSKEHQLASRLLDLVDLVDRGGALRIADICASYSVNRACAAGYVAWVRQRRELVEEREGRTKVWRKRPAEEGAPDALNRAAALAFAERALSELDGSAHYAALHAMAHEARLAVPEGGRARLDRLTRNFQVRRADRSIQPNRATLLAALMRAIDERRRCSMTYQKGNGQVKTYDIEPWGLVLHEGRLLFVAGKAPERGGPTQRRTFSLDGVQHLQIIEHGRFPEPAPHQTEWAEIFRDSFSIYCDWQDPPADVHIQVRGRWRTALQQRNLHPSQQVAATDPEWVDVRLRVVLCPDLLSWILSMLPDVRVVAPEKLRRQVSAAVEAWPLHDGSRIDP